MRSLRGRAAAWRGALDDWSARRLGRRSQRLERARATSIVVHSARAGHGGAGGGLDGDRPRRRAQRHRSFRRDAPPARGRSQGSRSPAVRPLSQRSATARRRPERAPAHNDEMVRRAIGKAGDLAHGLKTPLAILSNEAQRLEGTGDPGSGGGIAQQTLADATAGRLPPRACAGGGVGNGGGRARVGPRVERGSHPRAASACTRAGASRST